MGEGQFCSEDPHARGRSPALIQPRQDIPGFQRCCPLKGQPAGVCQTCPGTFLGLDLLVPFHLD